MVAVGSHCSGTVLDWKFSGGGMVQVCSQKLGKGGARH